MFNGLKYSRYVVASDTLNVERSGFLGRVIFSTRSGEMLSVSQQVWDLVESGRLDDLTDETRQLLVAANILVPEDEDELKAVVSDNFAAIEENDVLYQVVQPSAWCQLDCSYCGQEHAVKRLSEANEDAFLKRIRARLGSGKYHHLKIGWFGAEPLAGLSVIRTLTPRAQLLAKEFGCSYSAKIVTNGLALTPRLANELFHKHGIGEAEITLDGLAQQHDQLRFTKTGKGSFDRIFFNLKAVATTTEMRLVVRCNVGIENVGGVVPLIEKLAEEGLASLLSFYTSPIYAWGNDADKAALSKEEYAHLEMEWLALQFRLGFPVGLVPPRRKIVCMSVQKDAEVLDAYGASFNCTEVPYVPAYGTPNTYEIGALDSDTKTIRIYPLLKASPASKLSTFNDQIISGEQQACAQCAMLPVCGGQCPKAWHEQQEPCPSAKINMKNRLNVLFALQQGAV
jgi:uncharacterized protein